MLCTINMSAAGDKQITVLRSFFLIFRLFFGSSKVCYKTTWHRIWAVNIFRGGGLGGLVSTVPWLVSLSSSSVEGTETSYSPRQLGPASARTVFVLVSHRLWSDDHRGVTPSDQILLNSYWKNFLNALLGLSSESGSNKDVTQTLKAVPRLACCVCRIKLLLFRHRGGTDCMFRLPIQSREPVLLLSFFFFFFFFKSIRLCPGSKHIDFFLHLMHSSVMLFFSPPLKWNSVHHSVALQNPKCALAGVQAPHSATSAHCTARFPVQRHQ